MTEYVKKSDVLELLSLPKDLIAEYVCDLKGLWIDDDEAEQTEPNSSEKPNNCEVKNYCDDCLYTDTCDSKEFFYACTSKATISKMEQVEDEPQTYKINPKEPTNDDKCFECYDFFTCGGQCNNIENEPQTDTEIAKAIVHKMIDDAVIAEDAYPDLRQKMHDAVDEYEPQTDCAWR